MTIGNFDGVHRGHGQIISRLREHAETVEGPAVVFTFDPHPVRLLRPEQAPPPLTWTDRKAELLEAAGVDVMVVYATDAALLQLDPEQFFERIVLQKLAAAAIVEGPNFYFGRDRAGDIQVLRQLCEASKISLEIVPPLTEGEAYISSSRIRQLIKEGQVDQARLMLTQPYRIRGMVTHGAARGSQIGFPTANLDAIDTLLPALGVYAGRAFVGDESWPTAINIGPNPTFGEQATKVEAHLIGFDGSLYGTPVEVDFLSQLRDIRPFGSVDELVQQLHQDVHHVKQIVERLSV